MTNEHAIDVIKHLKKYYNDKNEWEDGYIGFDNEDNEAIDLAIKALKQQPCEDCISRQAVLDVINFEDKWLFDANGHNANTHIAFNGLESRVKALPPVTPQYTDEEIDKAQAIEQAYVDKMVELTVEELRREWLNSFDTNSATKCFEAVNLLKQRLEGEE